MLSITLLESSHKENYNSQNSHIKTPNITQRLLKTKLKECFMYLYKVARIIISVVYLLNLLPLFIMYHLGMMVLLGIYRRFGKTWSMLCPHLPPSVFYQPPAYQWGHPPLLEDTAFSHWKEWPSLKPFSSCFTLCHLLSPRSSQERKGREGLHADIFSTLLIYTCYNLDMCGNGS